MAGWTDTLYLKSPVPVQQALVAAYGWWWYRRRFGSTFRALSEDFLRRDRWSAAEFRAFQERAVRALVDAAAAAPHYRAVLADHSNTSGTPALEALERLPFLTKERLRTAPKSLLTRPPPRGTMVQRSSGTTGTPTEIYFTPQMHACELAMTEARSLRWAGVTHRDRRVMFGARKVCHIDQVRPPFWRFSPVEDLAYASIYHLSAANVPHYLELLRSFRPTVVMGYPNALAVIARHALERGDLPPRAKAVITTSETVTEPLRAAIEAAWQCRVYDRYGAVECCALASQCEHGSYHVSPDVGIVEIVDADGHPCPLGVSGEVVCTGLHNTLQPLIRYRIGDRARWRLDQRCACGREMPILEAIEGRIEDTCVTPDGRQVLRFDTVFKGVANVREAQIVQESRDRFVVKVVPADGYAEKDTRQLEHNLRLHVGQVRTEVELVPEIPRLASGKFQAVICKLSREEATELLRGVATG